MRVDAGTSTYLEHIMTRRNVGALSAKYIYHSDISFIIGW